MYDHPNELEGFNIDSKSRNSKDLSLITYVVNKRSLAFQDLHFKKKVLMFILVVIGSVMILG